MRKNSLKHITPSLHVPLGYAVIPPDDVSMVTAEFGGPSDVVATSLSEPDISLLTDVV